MIKIKDIDGRKLIIMSDHIVSVTIDTKGSLITILTKCKEFKLIKDEIDPLCWVEVLRYLELGD
jgi:hypothetical protein